ncbi:MAG: hypothetical protein MJ238_06325 [Bacilli bacterium]|nr:hypothetical protein [Bacilli bacterium]
MSMFDACRDYELSSFSYESGFRRYQDCHDTINMFYKDVAGDTFQDKTVNYLVSKGVPLEKINQVKSIMLD